MARLASQAKLGYYPTPDSVCECIKRLLSVKGDKAKVSVLDPCCGVGEFVDAIPEGVTTYGVEVNEDRYQEAKEYVQNLLYGDALYETNMTRDAFSCLYLNPPYDETQTITGESIRMELLFLQKYTSILQKEGLLIFIIPRKVLFNCAKHLSFHFKDLKVLPFPEDEYRSYNQVVVFGRKRVGKDDRVLKALEELGNWNEYYKALPLRRLDEYVNQEGLEPFDLPYSKVQEKTFRSLKINLQDMTAIVAKQGHSVTDLFTYPDETKITTPMPLRKGHMAMLLASGLMDGEFKTDNGDHWYIVKGTTSKRVIIEEDGESRTETDKIEITINALDLNKEEFVVIQ